MPTSRRARRSRRRRDTHGRIAEGPDISSCAGSARADAGFAFGTDLAELIMTTAGIDFRTAHRLIAQLVRNMMDSGARGSRPVCSDLDAIATATIGRPLGLPQQQLDQAVDPSSPCRAAAGLAGRARSRERSDRRMSKQSRWPCRLAGRDFEPVRGERTGVACAGGAYG